MDAWFHPETGAVVQLQAAHLDHDPGNNEDGNLAALCQACHNRHDGRKRQAKRRRRQRKAAGICATDIFLKWKMGMKAVDAAFEVLRDEGQAGKNRSR